MVERGDDPLELFLDKLEIHYPTGPRKEALNGNFHPIIVAVNLLTALRAEDQKMSGTKLNRPSSHADFKGFAQCFFLQPLASAERQTMLTFS